MPRRTIWQAMSESAAPPGRMNVEQFLAWVRQQPEGRYELHDGLVVTDMAPEVARHARAKGETFIALRSAIKAAGLPCEAFIDGLGIRTDAETMFIPDVVVNCGASVEATAQTLPAPVIVVEILSPSTERKDAVRKFAGYFRLPALQHYLLVDAADRMLVHHRKQPDGSAQTAILGGGALTLDPPGLTVQVEELFGPA